MLLRKWYASKKHFAELDLQHGWKTAGIDMIWRNYVTVTLCILRHCYSDWLCLCRTAVNCGETASKVERIRSFILFFSLVTRLRNYWTHNYTLRHTHSRLKRLNSTERNSKNTRIRTTKNERRRTPRQLYKRLYKGRNDTSARLRKYLPLEGHTSQLQRWTVTQWADSPCMSLACVPTDTRTQTNQNSTILHLLDIVPG